MKLYVCSKETGSRIEEVSSISEGLAVISEFEQEDKETDTYTEDFYSIEDENYHDVI